MEFKGSKEYVSTDDLSIAVNAAINLEKPLLVKGEPGTGKTELARQISKSLNLEICLLYTSPSPRDMTGSRMPSSA